MLVLLLRVYEPVPLAVVLNVTLLSGAKDGFS